MVYVQAVKPAWSTLHKVLLQTLGNKQRETDGSVLCLEVEGEENGTVEKGHGKVFFPNIPKPFSANDDPLLLLLCYSNSFPVLQVSKVI